MRRLAVVFVFSLALGSRGSGGPTFDTTASTSSPTTTIPPPTTTSATTTEATTTTAATTTTVGSRPVTLSSDGLGLVSFDDPADDVLAVLEEALGPPDILLDSEEAIIASDDSYFYGGPDVSDVLAIWRPIGLFVAFSKYPFYRQDGALHFSGWATTLADQDAAPLTTEADIGVGSTFDEIRNSFGDRLVMSDDVCGPVAYLIPQGEDDRALRIGLVFEEGAAEPGEAQLVALQAGASPGC